MKQDIDPDNTGRVDLPEFLALMAREYKEVDAQKELFDAFKVIQGDLSAIKYTGFKHGLTNAMEKCDELTKEQAAALMKLVDPNDTKKIHFEQFIEIITTKYIN